eukprot:TRINITY_DN2437_c0_g1_i2.p1 TRINITY_DN2437_c0_g1~~TRINITY_DN2437_c0_g1_i2.p1  ORF type:complete len:431 (-),score=73.00 TRINITY_DN2437_c0_g1_i2:1028-2197(-)
MAKRLIAMLVLSSLFMTAELVTGFMTNSLALISDAFHMISDIISLIVAFAARLAMRKASTDRMSYGWRRAEILGGFANGVFLLSVCLFIFMEAITRFANPENITDPIRILIVAGAGLLFNIVGMFLFGGHAGHSHDHGGHSHDHGEHDHGDKKGKKKKHEHKHGEKHEHKHGKKSKRKDAATAEIRRDTSPLMAPSSVSINVDTGEIIPALEEVDKKDEKANKKKGNINIHGLFLHILSDALFSVGVIISALCLQFMPEGWVIRLYIDPMVSVLFTIIILKSTVGIVRKAARILLQAVPEGINLGSVRAKLEKVDGVLNVHDLHCWLLTDSLAIASLHITCDVNANFMVMMEQLAKVLHKNDIHSWTIQPEFVGLPDRGQVLFKNKCPY